MTDLRDDLIILLEDGPQPTGTLARWTQQPQPLVYAELHRMARAGLVRRVDAEQAWALVSQVRPVPARRVSPARVYQAPDGDEDDALLDAGEPIEDDETLTEDPDADLTDELLQPTVQRSGRRRPRNLRHPHERPSRISLKDVEPSWWIGLSREQFAQESRQRQDAMSASREAKMVGPGRRLD